VKKHWENRVISLDRTISNISKHSPTRNTGCRYATQGTRVRRRK